jgi:hypothetical protein
MTWRFDPLTISARPILQPPDDNPTKETNKNKVPKCLIYVDSATPPDDNFPILCFCSKNLTRLGKGYIFVGEGPGIRNCIKVDIHGYQNYHIPGYYISLWFSNVF